MFPTRLAWTPMLTALTVACAPTYQVGERTLSAAEYELYQAEKDDFGARCDRFRREFQSIVYSAINGEISSEDLEREYRRKPTHWYLKCRIESTAIAAPQPRDEDYISWLESNAENSFAREQAAEKCGSPRDRFREYLVCVDNYVEYWRNTDRMPVAPVRYIDSYKKDALAKMSFDRLKGLYYYFAMDEARKRLDQFEFLHRIKPFQTTPIEDQLDSLDARLYSIERLLE